MTARSVEAQAYRHLYDTAAWKRLRDWQLRNYPLCRHCAKQQLATPATVVDHVKPHHGNTEIFFSSINLQSLCKSHHDSAKQSHERTGIERGCNVDGTPNDAGSHWNAPGRGSNPLGSGATATDEPEFP